MMERRWQPGDEVVIAPHAKMMIHDAAGFMDIFGFYNPRDLDDVMGRITSMRDRLEETSNNIAGIYAERSDTDTETWRAAMRAETWYTDQEAVDAGLADRVGRSNDETADRFAARMVARLDPARFVHGREVAALQESLSDESENDEQPADESTNTTEEPNGDTESSQEQAALSRREMRSQHVDSVLEALGV